MLFDSEIEWNLAQRSMKAESINPTILNVEIEGDTMCVQGNKHYTKGEYKLALKYYDKGINLLPLSVRILSNRVAVHMSMESWTLAKQVKCV
jgi:hypothetical protein